MALLRTEHVTKRFGEKIVLEDFNLALPAQGYIAFMGPSGCGKSTLLRLIAGLEKPDSGTVMLPPRAEISMVFQEDRLLEWATVRENILAVLSGGRKCNEPTARLWLERCGIADSADLYPAQLSGGMQRRVAIARAMAYGGDILLLDEAFSGLDEDTKSAVAAFVFDPELARDRLTIMITHDEREALELADTVYYTQGIPLRIVDTHSK